jgi:hypothetical protein
MDPVFGNVPHMSSEVIRPLSRSHCSVMEFKKAKHFVFSQKISRHLMDINHNSISDFERVGMVVFVEIPPEFLSSHQASEPQTHPPLSKRSSKASKPQV